MSWKNDAKAGGSAAVWAVIAIVFAILLTAGIFAVRVATSGPKGQGDAIIQKNSAANWTEAQARFENDYQDILATDRKITTAADALTEDPNDRTLRTNYTGVVNYCLTAVGDYNANARKYLSRDFRAADLPAQIDDRNPDTDCKE